MDPYLKIIERLNLAEGPDRRLDFAIHDALFPSQPSSRPARVSDVELPEGFGDDAFSHAMDPRPDYTASIDAALTLVPEGMDWDVAFLHENKKPQATIMWVKGIADATMAKRINCIVGAPVNWAEHTKGATPAIALSIAALKARASMKSADDAA